MPNLLVAPVSPTVQSKEKDLYADYPQGYYADGAYTAIPQLQSKPKQTHTNGEQQEDQDPQEAYYVSLSARFAQLTQTLRSLPPRSGFAPSDTNVYYLDWKGRRLWRGKILNTAPTMVVLAQLTQESVMDGLEVLGSLVTFSRLGGERGGNIGAWAWGLLGRCREVGQMGSEEVGVLREVGKRAVWLLRRVTAGEVIGGDGMDAGVEEDDDEESGEEEDGDGDGGEERVEVGAESSDAEDAYPSSFDPTLLQNPSSPQPSTCEIHPPTTTTSTTSTTDTAIAKAKQRILDSLHSIQQPPHTNPTNNEETPPPPPYPLTETQSNSQENSTENVMSADEKKTIVIATLDMLVTVVGEVYGQRDLLGGRLLWEEME